MKIDIVHHSQVTIVDDYYRHWYLKNDLLNFLENHHDVQNRETNVKATMTDWTMKRYSPIVNQFKDLIFSVIRDEYMTFNEKVCNHELRYESFWGNIYRKGDYTIEHDHKPSAYSVVYFLKSKPNFSPLIIENFNTKTKKNKPLVIKPLEGRLVIFPGSLKHKVPVHIHDETRITLSANVY